MLYSCGLISAQPRYSMACSTRFFKLHNVRRSNYRPRKLFSLLPGRKLLFMCYLSAFRCFVYRSETTSASTKLLCPPVYHSGTKGSGSSNRSAQLGSAILSTAVPSLCEKFENGSKSISAGTSSILCKTSQSLWGSDERLDNVAHKLFIQMLSCYDKACLHFFYSKWGYSLAFL